MLGIQNQAQIQATNAVAFKSKDSSRSNGRSATGPDGFNREKLEQERDEQICQINESVEGFENLAKQLEESGAKKAGKGVRFVASLIGLAATFVLAKYSSKFVIESIKSVAKSPAVTKTVDAASNAAKTAEGYSEKLLQNPKVTQGIEKIKQSPFVQKVINTLKKPGVAKVVEPAKKVFNAVKNFKISGKTIQTWLENGMAGITTASVAVDNAAGRNDNKSATELMNGGI